MNQNQSGSKAYLFSIVLVAVLGGLLFGYDTAVISGAEKGLQAFFIGAQDFTYTDAWHGFTCASALIGCIIGSAVSGYSASNWGRKKSLIFAGIMFFISALGSMEPEFLFFEHGVANYPLLIAFNIYRVIGGVGVGLASAICPIAELTITTTILKHAANPESTPSKSGWPAGPSHSNTTRGAAVTTASDATTPKRHGGSTM